MASLATTLLLPWPLSTFAALAVAPPLPPDALPPAKRYASGPVLVSPLAHVAIIVSAAWKVLFAAAVYYATWPRTASAVAAAAALSPAWVARVVARNVAITWAVGVCWDWLHLSPSSPLFARLQALKFSGVPARWAQVLHDARWATCSAVVAALWEVALAHAWALGALRLAAPPRDAWWAHAPTLLLLLALPHVQIVHFFAVHRFMHAWWPPAQRRRRRGCCAALAAACPDPGALLYRHVHAVHHRSRDPTAFSGISMHPVESALFFTTMPLAAWCGAHPIVILHAELYNIVVAMIGHESYGDPSTGGFDHWLHHQLVDANYGGTFVPLDWLFGSYVRDEDEFAAKAAADRDGEDAGGAKRE